MVNIFNSDNQDSPMSPYSNNPNQYCHTGNQSGAIFEALTESEKKILDLNSVVIHYRKGETICKQGSFATNIISLEQGLVKVFLEGSPKNLILTITPAGNLIGVPSMFESNNTFLYSVTTYVESVVRMIDIQVFRNLLKENAGFAFRILSMMNENTAQTYGRFFCITQKHLHGRLADILICLSARIFKNPSFELPLSRSDLGELTGMSTESVIRLMKEFKSDGLIELSGKSIKLIDIPRLKKISELG